MRRLMFTAALLLGSICYSHAELIDIMVSNAKVDLTVRDAQFSDVLGEFSRQAGFDLDLPDKLSESKISMQFSGVPVERAIQRLFNLIQEKNYSIYYGTDGVVKLLKVYHIEAKPQPEVAEAPRVPERRRRVAPIPRRRRPELAEPEIPEEEFFEEGEEEMLEPQYYDEDLYIPPRRSPYGTPRR